MLVKIVNINIRIYIIGIINVFSGIIISTTKMQSSQDKIKLLQQAIAKEDTAQILTISSSLTKENPQDL